MKIYIHLALFVLTVASTFFVGGPLYCASLMIILLCHEMGHYLTSRRYGVPSSLPYFIPLPLPPFGTFGAVIKMKGAISNKKALFDIGASGPIAGFLVSLPFIFIGIALSEIHVVTGQMAFMKLGDPLLFKIAQRILIGTIPEGYDVVLHPVGYAGWVGLFVTSLNLLPVGQLDGGHVVFAVFGPRSKRVFLATIILLALLSIFYSPGWIVLVILLMIFGMRHPDPVDMETGLDFKRKIAAVLVLIMFILSFTPAPFPQITFGTDGGISP